MLPWSRSTLRRDQLDRLRWCQSFTHRTLGSTTPHATRYTVASVMPVCVCGSSPPRSSLLDFIAEQGCPSPKSSGHPSAYPSSSTLPSSLTPSTTHQRVSHYASSMTYSFALPTARRQRRPRLRQAVRPIPRTHPHRAAEAQAHPAHAQRIHSTPLLRCLPPRRIF